MRHTLVVVQVALSLMLVVGALLFVRTLRNLMSLDPGFRQDGLVVANFDMRRAEIPEARRIPLYQDMTDKLRALPRVDGAAQSFIVPVSGSGWNDRIILGGTVQKEFPNFNRIGPGYFTMMGTPLIAGRDFRDLDTTTAPPVAIVNESFAKKFFAGQSPSRLLAEDRFHAGRQHATIRFVAGGVRRCSIEPRTVWRVGR